MCGACGTAGPAHWSAPFLASQPARATAARAVTAMIGPVAAVAAASAGFLIRRPTGATTIAPHLGAVWLALDRIKASRPAPDSPPPHIVGPVTLPPTRTRLLEVHLVLCNEPTDPPSPESGAERHPATAAEPGYKQQVDGRGADPHDLIARLHALALDTARSGAPRAAQLVLAAAELPRTLPHLVADPTRPYQLRLEPIHTFRDCLEQRPHAVPQRPSASSIPALLTWAAGCSRQRQPERLIVRLPAQDDHAFELQMLHGVVTRCTVERDSQRRDPTAARQDASSLSPGPARSA